LFILVHSIFTSLYFHSPLLEPPTDVCPYVFDIFSFLSLCLLHESFLRFILNFRNVEIPSSSAIFILLFDTACSVLWSKKQGIREDFGVT
jgi:hypothetical protein